MVDDELAVSLEAVAKADLTKLLTQMLIQLHRLQRDVDDLKRKTIGAETS